MNKRQQQAINALHQDLYRDFAEQYRQTDLEPEEFWSQFRPAYSEQLGLWKFKYPAVPYPSTDMVEREVRRMVEDA